MEILAIIFVTFISTLIFTPLTIKLAKKIGLVDNPKVRPHPAHIHKATTPRAGGLPIYLSIIISSLLFLQIEKYLIGITIGITILLIVGLADDKIKKFSPYLRLILLFVAAGAAVASGIGISFITNPLRGLADLPSAWQTPFLRLDQYALPVEFFGSHYIVVIADLFAFFWIVTLTQVINWAKGVDGQMPGITLVAALTLGFLSLKLVSQGEVAQLNVAKLSFIVAAASLGLLFFNWSPAKIFPGFSGSTILAFMIAILAILSGAKVATALLVLAVPTADFVYTFSRRVLAGRSPVWGDRGHLHHKLLDIGWSAQTISLFYILGSAILGLIAVFLETTSKFFALLVVASIFTAFILWLNSFGTLSRSSDRDSG